ncbi:MAG: helix-turn-helix transcriptional regulator [Nitrospirae bacterium]|nr:helix-turn-helix transcriptional regulator [Nitrospirota bacterium]
MRRMTDNLLLHIGKRIQSIREKRRLTQEELEEKTGVNARYISAIECGQKNPTVKTLSKLAKGLDIELYELFLFSEELESEGVARKAIDSILKGADRKSLNLCLDFLRKC